MQYFIIFLLISNIISICIYLKERKKLNKERKKIEDDLKTTIEEKYEAMVAQKKSDLNDELQNWRKSQESIIHSDLEKETQIANLQKTNLQNEIDSQKKQLNSLKENQEEVLREHKTKVETQIMIELNDKRSKDFDKIMSELEAYIDGATAEKNAAQEELNQILAQLDEYRKKRNAMNEEILRLREMEEKQDFYRIELDEKTIHDLVILEEIKPQLSKIDFLDKFVYDIYISKPVNEMIKRVLQGEAPSGIYKITRLKTGEVYIGKSTDVKNRWIQHTKSCYNCGTISHSTLHTTMRKDGIQNFTFELLEKVSKDKLTEREKYWIEYFDSKKYGLNEKVG